MKTGGLKRAPFLLPELDLPITISGILSLAEKLDITMKEKTKKILGSWNRDLEKSPIELKAAHVILSDRNSLRVGPDWVSTRSWAVKRTGLVVGALLSHDWLRVGTLPVVSGERSLLIRKLLGLTARQESNLSLEIVKKDSVVSSSPGQLQQFRRTTAGHYENGTFRYIFRSVNKAGKGGDDVLSVDSRWTDLFGLESVWQTEDGQVWNHETEPTVILNARKGLPEEASVAATLGGWRSEK